MADDEAWIGVNCPICGGGSHDDVFTHVNRLFDVDTESTLQRCRACGLQLTNPQPRGRALSKLYEADYYTHEPPQGFRARVRRVLQRMQVRGPLARLRLELERRSNLRRFAMRLSPTEFKLPKGLSLLDYGCGRGVTVKIASDLGLDAHGIEPDARAREQAVRRGLRVHESFEALDSASSPSGERATFDRIVLSHVLEHVPEPRELLERLRSRLRPAGLLLLSVPNADSMQAQVFREHWIGYDMPRHLWHFSPATLRRFVESVGLEVRAERTVELSFYARDSAREMLRVTGRAVPYRISSAREIERKGLGAEVVMVLANG